MQSHPDHFFIISWHTLPRLPYGTCCNERGDAQLRSTAQSERSSVLIQCSTFPFPATAPGQTRLPRRWRGASGEHHRCSADGQSQRGRVTPPALLPRWQGWGEPCFSRSPRCTVLLPCLSCGDVGRAGWIRLSSTRSYTALLALEQGKEVGQTSDW